MKSIKALILLMFISLGMSAHQADVSTTMLVDQGSNVWVLQISSSLTAFQQEVKTHYSETPYNNPEEFQMMVLDHVKKNIQMSFNGDSEITFGEGVVKIGHETKVVIEVLGVPSDIKSSVITNTAFKDIHRSQSTLIILKEGAEKTDFILNKKNGFTMSLLMEDNLIISEQALDSNRFSIWTLIIVLSGIGLVSLIVLGVRNHRTRKSVISMV